MSKFAAIIAITAIVAIGTTTTAEAGARGLMTGLFIGAVGAHMIDQSYRAEQRREAYEAARLRRARAVEAQREAEYRRLQLEKVTAARLAAQDAADDAAEDASDGNETSAQTISTAAADTSAAPKGDMIETTPQATGTSTVTTAAVTAPVSASATQSSLTATSSADADNGRICRKYSPATDSMIDTRCPAP